MCYKRGTHAKVQYTSSNQELRQLKHFASSEEE